MFPSLPTFFWSIGIAGGAALISYIATHVKYAMGLKGHPFIGTLHLAAPKMQFYDLHLNNGVWYAFHAMSADENRADFARVLWGGGHNKGPERPDEYPDWLQQVWFAGNHSDVPVATRETRPICRISRSDGWSTQRVIYRTGRHRTATGIKVDER